MTENQTHPSETPLESWKEIAAYLKRDVRTVKRWEKSEALPVHRHLHQDRSTVYAYPSELDAWWAQRAPSVEKPAASFWQPAPLLASAALLLLALVSVASGPLVSPAGVAAAPEGAGMVARQVWAPAADTEGGVSPDGQYLTFVDWETGDLAVRDLTTGKNRRLTNKGEWTQSREFAEVSRVSPDGKQVAYGWFNGKFYDLRLIGLDGSGLRVVYKNPDVDYLEPGDWSPDGKYVSATLARHDKTNQIAVVNAADGSARILKTTDWRHPHLGPFSPDGRYFAYDFPPDQDSAARDIFLLAVDGSREVRVVEHPANDRVLGWTPDGGKLLFSSDRTGTYGIWAVRISDGKPQRAPELLRPAVGPIWPLGFTRAGAFYYSLEAGIRDAYVAPFDPATGQVGPPEPVSQRYLGSNGLPAWSADGKYIAYVRAEDPGRLSAALVIRPSLTGEERTFLLKLTFAGGPRPSPLCWSPDGRSVLVVGIDSKGRQGFYRADVETGNVAPFILSEPPTVISNPTWSRDGKALFYLRRDPAEKQTAIVRREVETGEEKELYRAVEPERVNTFALSPDDQQVVFRGGDYRTHDVLDVLKAIPATGGEPRELMRAPVPKNRNLSGNAGLQWTPDGAYLLFGRWQNWSAENLTVELWRVPGQGGEPQKLELAMERLWGIRMHPDGRRVAFTAGVAKEEVWVLENFLPALPAAPPKR